MKMLNSLCRPAYLYFMLSMFVLVFMVIQNMGNTHTYCIGNYGCQVPNSPCCVHRPDPLHRVLDVDSQPHLPRWISPDVVVPDPFPFHPVLRPSGSYDDAGASGIDSDLWHRKWPLA